MSDQGDQTFDNLTVNKNATVSGDITIVGSLGLDGTLGTLIRGGSGLFASSNLSVNNQVGIGIIIPPRNPLPPYNLPNPNISGKLIVIGGNVGIGISNPQAGLHIDKENTNDVALMLSSTGPGWGSGIQFKNNDILYGIFAGSECFHICDAKQQVDRLTIDAKGNVGIGHQLLNMC
jgi:hypothetical protein